MGHPSPRAPRPAHPAKPDSIALANWALGHTRPAEELTHLQAWVANEASVAELQTLLTQAPTLLYAVVSESLQTRLFNPSEECALSLFVASERQLQVAGSKLLKSDAGDYIVTSSWKTYSRYDGELVLCGSIAGYWACQALLAGSIEKAIVRLGLGRDLLEWKQRHSAHCARSLINWARVSSADVHSFPASHRLASGIKEMVEKYCALLSIKAPSVQPASAAATPVPSSAWPLTRQAAQY